MAKVISIEISEIRNKFDVRKTLDDDNILRLAELYQNNIEVDPIRVAIIEGEYCFVDGRHRAAARALLELKTIDAIVVHESNELQLYSEALRSNYGGSKPPTREDIEHTIRKMMEAGAKESHLKARLDFIPYSILRIYISVVQTTLRKRKIKAAIEAVADGMILAEAATKYGVKLDSLKDAISGRKRKWGTGESALLTEYTLYINRVLKTANSGISKKIQLLLVKLEDHEVKPETATRIIEHWGAKLNGTIHRIKDWKERLKAITEGKKSTEEEA